MKVLESTTPLEILLVEDNPGDVRLIKRVLENACLPIKLGVAKDGLDALSYLRWYESAEHITPHMILLDLNMPRMDGPTFLGILKADARLKCIPVVMFTSSDAEVDVDLCYKLQASCYVKKPFELDKFEETVHSIVNFWGTTVQLPLKCGLAPAQS